MCIRDRGSSSAGADTKQSQPPPPPGQPPGQPQRRASARHQAMDQRMLDEIRQAPLAKASSTRKAAAPEEGTPERSVADHESVGVEGIQLRESQALGLSELSLPDHPPVPSELPLPDHPSDVTDPPSAMGDRPQPSRGRGSAISLGATVGGEL